MSILKRPLVVTLFAPTRSGDVKKSESKPVVFLGKNGTTATGHCGP